MSATKRRYFLAIICLMAILGGGTYIFSTSTWFVWSALPAASLKIVGEPALLQRLAPLDNTKLPPVIFDTSKVRIVGISQTKEDITLAIMPHPLAASGVTTGLSSEGWQLTHVGFFYLCSKKGKPALSWHVVMAGLKKLFVNPVPLAPDFVVEADYTATNDGLLAIALKHNTTMKFLTVRDWTTLSAKPVGPHEQEMNVLQVAIPSHLLTGLADNLKAVWNQRIADRLGFRKSTPNFIDYLSQYQNLDYVEDGSGVALAVRGAADSFEKAALDWMLNEDRRSRPARKAFKLPDGSLGYEQVPGASQAILMPYNGLCRAPIAGKMSLWLCRKDGVAALGTNESLTERMLTNKSASDVAVTADVAGLKTANLCASQFGFWCDLDRLLLYGNHDRYAGIASFVK